MLTAHHDDGPQSDHTHHRHQRYELYLHCRRRDHHQHRLHQQQRSSRNLRFIGAGVVHVAGWLCSAHSIVLVGLFHVPSVRLLLHHFRCPKRFASQLWVLTSFGSVRCQKLPEACLKPAGSRLIMTTMLEACKLPGHKLFRGQASE